MAMTSPWCPSTSSIFLDQVCSLTLLYAVNRISCVYYVTEEKTIKIINKDKEDQYTELQRL